MEKLKMVSKELAMGFCVREAEGGETTPSFGHPSNVNRGKDSAEATSL